MQLTLLIKINPLATFLWKERGGGGSRWQRSLVREMKTNKWFGYAYEGFSIKMVFFNAILCSKLFPPHQSYSSDKP